VSVWLPVLGVFSVLAPVRLVSLDGERGLVQFAVAVAGGVMGLVLPVATVLTWRRDRRPG
jgi:hypothetical protein